MILLDVVFIIQLLVLLGAALFMVYNTLSWSQYLEQKDNLMVWAGSLLFWLIGFLSNLMDVTNITYAVFFKLSNFFLVVITIFTITSILINVGKTAQKAIKPAGVDK